MQEGLCCAEDTGQMTAGHGDGCPGRRAGPGSGAVKFGLPFAKPPIWWQYLYVPGRGEGTGSAFS